MYFIDHLRKYFNGMFGFMVFFAGVFITGTYFFSKNVEIYGFWLGLASFFLWAYTVCFSFGVLYIVFKGIPEKNKRQRRITRTMYEIASSRVDKDIIHLRNKLLKNNPANDQTRALIHDIALLLGVGGDIKDVQERLKQHAIANITCTYNVVYIEQSEERDPVTRKITRQEKKEGGFLDLCYGIDENHPEHEILKIW